MLTAVALLAMVSASPAVATPAFLSHSQKGFGTTMSQACEGAIALIEKNCAFHGTITTSPHSCRESWTPFIGEVVICDCTATATFCANLTPIDLSPPLG
jgi:hypothetical protein